MAPIYVSHYKNDSEDGKGSFKEGAMLVCKRRSELDDMPLQVTLLPYLHPQDSSSLTGTPSR
jgi:hypothetical protein